eukprot:SAG31_NODE_86_length_26973_cov_16.850897_30_plen_48_part_00
MGTLVLDHAVALVELHELHGLVCTSLRVQLLPSEMLQNPSRRENGRA